MERFKFEVPEEDLAVLDRKLDAAHFPDELAGSDGDLGCPLADIKRLVSYWKDTYLKNWKEEEAKINDLPNFKTSIVVDSEDLDIHFLHAKSTVENAIPLLFSHGWPGNFLEVSKIMPLLLEGGRDYPAFHVVAPSLPCFVFSSGTQKRGFGLKQYAHVCNELMLKLGYEQYVTQGGDWGCMITRIMGLIYPNRVMASHINMIRGHKPTFTSHPVLYLQHLLTPYTDREKAGLERSRWFTEEGAGYRTQQNTRPQTLGYSLADSPVGLLAWIYEKLRDWSDSRAHVFSDDEVLLWVSLYWFSKAGPAASLRIYYESIHAKEYPRSRTEEWIPHVKLGLSYFPRELSIVPKTWGRTMGPVVFENVHDKGGHFAAFENPEAMAGDLRKMFGKGGGAFGVVPGRGGYE